MRPRGPKKPDAAAPAGEMCDGRGEGRRADGRGEEEVALEEVGLTTLGPKPIASVTTEGVEDVRDKLDRAIEEWKRDEDKTASKIGTAISGKTAMNAWSALTSTFKAATTGKRRDLRVLARKPNPCAGVLPPGDEDSRAVRRKTFLYPKEALALLSCGEVPMEWREVYAVACYAYFRPSELRVLLWSDVDLEARLLSVTKAWDYEDGKVKPPKTPNGIRRVPIEPALVPLLERMKEEADDEYALVVPTLSTFGEDHLAQLFRRHLKEAKVERAELHRSTRTHVQSNFRSCRDSGLTWLALTASASTRSCGARATTRSTPRWAT